MNPFPQSLAKEPTMRRSWAGLAILSAALYLPAGVQAACCYFSAKNTDILQPAQKAFLTWEPQEKVETFTVQPKFEGNALDFGMVIPTPTRPKLDEMPRDFFKALAVYSILKKREQPQSKLLYRLQPVKQLAFLANGRGIATGKQSGRPDRPPTVVV